MSPWKNQYVLIELYREHSLQFTEISEVLNCHPETAKLWVSKLANPRVVHPTVEVSDDFSVDVYTESGEFSASLIGFESEFFDDENITLEESDNGDMYNCRYDSFFWYWCSGRFCTNTGKR